MPGLQCTARSEGLGNQAKKCHTGKRGVFVACSRTNQDGWLRLGPATAIASLKNDTKHIIDPSFKMDSCNWQRLRILVKRLDLKGKFPSNQKMVDGNTLLVVGLDFGTTYSGFAFSTTHQFKQKPDEIFAYQWPESRNVSLKTSTCALIDQAGDLISFGYEAEEKYNELIVDEDADSYFFFHRFKMKLYDKSLSANTLIEDVRGKSMSAIRVFALCIEYLVEKAQEAFMSRGLNFKDDEIKWVLTVPAIWNDKAKQFMRTAAEKAGIFSNQLKIALEPEAASIYCQFLSIDKLSGAEKGFSMSAKGTKYLILDLGGGTADITVHEKLDHGKLKELHRASGGACGGTEVDNTFLQNIFYKIVGTNVVNKFKEKHPGGFLDLLRDIEGLKRVFKTDKTSMYNIRIPIASLDEVCKEELDETLKQCLESSHLGKNITLVGDKLRIKADLVKDFFQKVTDQILGYLNKVLKDLKVSDISMIILVGGFSECKAVELAIRNAYPTKKVIVPYEAGLAVLKGAVIFGHCPDMVAMRIIPYSYGVRTTPVFDNNKHRNDKKFNQSGTDRCMDVCCQFMHAGTEAPLSHKEEAVYNTTVPNQSSMLVRIFYSPKDQIEYVDDSDCEELGELEVTIPNPSSSTRHLKVQYEFGETELSVTAVEVESNEKCVSKFNLL